MKDLRQSRWYSLLLCLYGYQQINTVPALVELKTEVLTPVLDHLLEEWAREEMIRGAWLTETMESLMNETKRLGKQFAASYWTKVPKDERQGVFHELMHKLSESQTKQTL